jgi:hypothetical protein
MTVIIFALFLKATIALEPISYRGALLNTLLHATVYMFLHNLLNVLVQVANKMGLLKMASYQQTSIHINEHLGSSGT